MNRSSMAHAREQQLTYHGLPDATGHCAEEAHAQQERHDALHMNAIGEKVSKMLKKRYPTLTNVSSFLYFWARIARLGWMLSLRKFRLTIR